MSFDPAKHLHHFDGLDLTETEKFDLIEMVRHMMEGFVDIAFGTNSEQITLDYQRKERALALGALVQSDQSFTNIFNDKNAGA